MPRKRTNGEGSIYPRKIKGTEYLIVEITTGFDDNGKRLKKTTSAKTRTEAVEKLKKLQADFANGLLVKTEKASLYQWLIDFLQTFKQGKIKPTTYDGYIQLVNHYFKGSAIGKRQIQKLTTTDIQRYLKPLELSGKTETMRKLKIILNMALRKAVQVGLIPKNVADFIELPKTSKSKDVSILTSDEITRLIATAEHDRSRILPAIKLALDTGLRRGEVLGLTWDDVDLENGKLQIRQNVVETSSKKIIQTPKTNDSIRNVQLLPETVELLRDLKISSTSPYLFSQLKDKTPMSPRHFSRIYRRLCSKAGINNSKYHALRHTHATEMIEAGMDTKVVSERLGHTDIRTTFNVYVHPSEGFHKQELAKLQNKRNKTILH